MINDIPNILTLMRIALIPILVSAFYLDYNFAHYIVVCIFIFASFTDFLDGFLARKLKLVTDFNEGGTNNLSGDYLTLYNNYIIKILCYTVYADYLRDGFILAQNTGVFQNTPDDKGGADLSDVQFVAKQNKSKADVYLERMERFLCDKNITEYNSAQENTYDIDPREVNTISGWYLPRSNSYEEGKIIINTGTGTNTDGSLELQDE